MYSKIDINTRVKLNNGVEMPILGLGVWKSRQGGEVEAAVEYALQSGYRSVDTAAMYKNEIGVGAAIRNSGIPREEIFVTTKVWNSDQGYESTITAIKQSLDKLKFDYIDLYLIHWPVTNKYVETWRAMEEINRLGLAKSIGVSNFMESHLRNLLKSSELIPAVNQIEFHPYLVQQDLVNYCESNMIYVEAWSPLMQGRVNEVSLLSEIGLKYGKTAAQVVLRWNLQKKVITIPKSSNPSRIDENANIFDFELTQEEIREINGLNRNYRFGPDPNNFDF